MSERVTRLTMAQLRKLKSLSNQKKFEQATEVEIARQIADDPDLYELTDQELAEFDLARSRA